MSSVHDSWTAPSGTPLVSAAFERLNGAVRRLSRDIARGRRDSSYYGHVKESLTSVPITTGEHAWAVCRLENAMFYAAAGEQGGACYELRLLLRKLVKCRQMNQL
jgi:hypothetical protein